jgi:hypothetical protein
MVFMRRGNFFFLLILVVILFPAAVGFAQTPGGNLETLQVRFWPDFDDPSVLVLINGELPDETILPVEITIPIPEGAEINAVAHISGQEMLSLDFETTSDSVTFFTPSPRFLVEYYAPYQQDGSSRSYEFEWISDLSVDQFVAEVQQPANATSLATEPGASNVFNGQTDGLTYYGLDPTSVPAGTPYRLSFNYEMSSDDLTVAPVAPAPVETINSPASTEEQGDNNWLLFAGIAALVALAVVGTWLVVTRTNGRKSSKPVKPRPKARSSKKTATVYCHNCGQAAEGNDRFCRRCGTELKR